MIRFLKRKNIKLYLVQIIFIIAEGKIQKVKEKFGRMKKFF